MHPSPWTQVQASAFPWGMERPRSRRVEFAQHLPTLANHYSNRDVAMLPSSILSGVAVQEGLPDLIWVMSLAAGSTNKEAALAVDTVDS